MKHLTLLFSARYFLQAVEKSRAIADRHIYILFILLNWFVFLKVYINTDHISSYTWLIETGSAFRISTREIGYNKGILYTGIYPETLNGNRF